MKSEQSSSGLAMALILDQSMKKVAILKWMPAILVMCAIFWFSVQPSDNLPDYGMLDRLVKKGGHMLGYGLLALSYWYALNWDMKKRPLAWLFAMLFAVTDEIHQSFVQGRHPSVWDVLIFDNLGALTALWLASVFIEQKRSDENNRSPTR